MFTDSEQLSAHTQHQMDCVECYCGVVGPQAIYSRLGNHVAVVRRSPGDRLSYSNRPVASGPVGAELARSIISGKFIYSYIQTPQKELSPRLKTTLFMRSKVFWAESIFFAGC